LARCIVRACGDEKPDSWTLTISATLSGALLFFQAILRRSAGGAYVILMRLLSAVGDLHGFDPSRSRRQAEAAEPSATGSLGGRHLRGDPTLLSR